MCTTNVAQNVIRFFMLFFYLSVIITHGYNETAVNEMAAKLNMSNETLHSLFLAVPINFSGFYNKSEVDMKIQSYDYTVQLVNSSVGVQLGKLITTLLDSYVNASVSNASQKISPVISILRDDMNIRFDALKNITVRNYQLERNISELSQNVTQYAYNAAINVKYELDQKINWIFMLAFLMSMIIPIAIYLATTRIYSLRMKILGSVPDLRKYAIEDLNLNPMTRDEIQKRKELKLSIIKLKCDTQLMKDLLNKVDIDEINNEQDIKDVMEILGQERKLKHEANDKYPAKQGGKAKH